MRALGSEAVSRQRATCFTRTGQTLTQYDTCCSWCALSAAGSANCRVRHQAYLTGGKECQLQSRCHQTKKEQLSFV